MLVFVLFDTFCANSCWCCVVNAFRATFGEHVGLVYVVDQVFKFARFSSLDPSCYWDRTSESTSSSVACFNGTMDHTSASGGLLCRVIECNAVATCQCVTCNIVVCSIHGPAHERHSNGLGIKDASDCAGVPIAFAGQNHGENEDDESFECSIIVADGRHTDSFVPLAVPISCSSSAISRNTGTRSEMDEIDICLALVSDHNPLSEGETFDPVLYGQVKAGVRYGNKTPDEIGTIYLSGTFAKILWQQSVDYTSYLNLSDMIENKLLIILCDRSAAMLK